MRLFRTAPFREDRLESSGLTHRNLSRASCIGALGPWIYGLAHCYSLSCPSDRHRPFRRHDRSFLTSDNAPSPSPHAHFTRVFSRFCTLPRFTLKYVDPRVQKCRKALELQWFSVRPPPPRRVRKPRRSCCCARITVAAPRAAHAPAHYRRPRNRSTAHSRYKRSGFRPARPSRRPFAQAFFSTPAVRPAAPPYPQPFPAALCARSCRFRGHSPRRIPASPLRPSHGSGSIHIAPGWPYIATEPSSTTAANFFGESCTNPRRAGTCAGFRKSSTLDVLVGGG